MRSLEILLLISLVLRLFVPPLAPRARWRVLINGLTLAVVVTTFMQTAFEGYRWQMVPLYLLAVLTTVSTLLQNRATTPPEPSRARTALTLVGAVLALALAAPLPLILPIPQLPAPSGGLPVGTLTWALTDSQRTDPYAPTPNTPRRFMVQVWYPTTPAAGTDYDAWMPDARIVAPAIAQWIHMPAFFLDHLVYARGHAVTDAPLAPGTARFPILLFSHGWGGFRQQSTHQMETLASLGYVVAAVEHTYGSVTTVFPDGTIAAHNGAGLPDGVSPEEYHRAAEQLVALWAGDLSFTLDTLTADDIADPQGRFTGRLALDQVGVFGHSTGAGAAITFCAQDSRCRAGIGLDPYVTPLTDALVATGPPQPFLFINSSRWPIRVPDNAARVQTLYANLPGPAYQLTMDGTDHYDFTDLPALSPLAPALGLKGPLPAESVMQIIDGYERAFFGQYLLGQSSDLLNANTSPFPAVQNFMHRP